MKQYISTTGRKRFKPSADELRDIIEGDNDAGYCLACGDLAEGIEPDARGYTCESCDAKAVYGAEQLLLMGLYYDEVAS